MEIEQILSRRITDQKFNNFQKVSYKGQTGFEKELHKHINKNEPANQPGAFKEPILAEQLKLFAENLQIKMNQSLLSSLLSGDAPAQGHNPLSESLSQLLINLNTPENFRFQTQHPGPDSRQENNTVDTIINSAAKKHDLDPKLIRSVIRAESSFNPDATSVKGAMGLMQLMPGTAQELGVKDPYNPEDNIMGGTKYLKMLINRYSGNLNMALAAYNWGMGNLERTPERIPKETRDYIARIYSFYNEK